MMSAMHTGLVLAEVGVGRIQGGWGYIWSSYTIAWASLALYALSLWLRRPGKAANESKE
jgi:hypothetical protein